MAVHPSVPARTVTELIAYAKANPAAPYVHGQRQPAASVRRTMNP